MDIASESVIGIDALHLETIHKITSPQKYKVVLTLAASGKSLAYSQLLALTAMNPGTLKKHLDDLMESGVVEKTVLEKYRRDSPRSFYMLSEKGLEILENTGILTAKQIQKLQKFFLKTVKPE
ncbi:MAG: ArsR family transcriptional regulator [Candidatus Hydrothermarchaeaceae archaeon]